MKYVVLFVFGIASSFSLTAQIKNRIQSPSATRQEQRPLLPPTYFNPSAVSGTVTLEGPAASSLFGTNEGNRVLKAELWKAKLYARHNNTSFHATELISKMGDVIFSNTIQKGDELQINYAFSNIPPDGSVAIIVYTNENTFLPGFEINSNTPSQAIGLNNNIAKAIAGNLGSWCIVPLYKSQNPQATVSELNFSVREQPAGIIKTKSLIGDITNLFEDALDGLVAVTPAGVQSFAGLFMNNTGGLVMMFGISLLGIITYGNLPQARLLTDEEYKIADDFFSGSLPAKNNIIVTNLMGVNRRPFTIPGPGNKVYLNLGDLYDNPLNKTRKMNEINGQTFIHEMAHAWQIEHNPDLKNLKEGAVNQWRYTVLDDKTVYSYSCGSRWEQYNFEQQASIAEDCFVLTTALKAGDCERELVEKNIRNGNPFPPPSFGRQNDKYNYRAEFSAGYQPSGNNCIPINELNARFAFFLKNRIYVITGEGETKYYEFINGRLGSAKSPEGPPVAAKEGIDQFVLPYANNILVVTSTGDVWAHPVDEKKEGDMYRRLGEGTISDATMLEGDKVLYSSVPGRDAMEGVTKRPFRYLTISGNIIYGVTETGVVHKFEINGNNIRHYSVTGPKVAANPQDRFVFALSNYIYVTTKSGDVFRHPVIGNKIYDPEKCSGAKVAANGAIDRFLVPIPSNNANSVMVIRGDCGVWLQHAPGEMIIK
jgi:hypothetical protein